VYLSCPLSLIGSFQTWERKVSGGKEKAKGEVSGGESTGGGVSVLLYESKSRLPSQKRNAGDVCKRIEGTSQLWTGTIRVLFTTVRCSSKLKGGVNLQKRGGEESRQEGAKNSRLFGVGHF